MRVCDQEDCLIYPHETESKKHIYVEPYNEKIIYDSFSIKVEKPSLKIKIEELDVTLDMRCLLCLYLKKVNMKTELKIFEAKEVLSE